MRRRGVFVTGTDTGVGKTLVSACFASRWQADYWKPAQTGLAEEDGDSARVARLMGLGPDRVHPPAHEFAAPLSVEAAAACEGARVKLSDFRLPPGGRPIVVEGAGGVLVPIAKGVVMADLMARLKLPVVLVARTALGTINHTLLSLEALRAREIAVAGVVMAGVPNAGNSEAIARHGKVRILHEMPRLARVSGASMRTAAGAFPDIDAVLG